MGFGKKPPQAEEKKTMADETKISGIYGKGKATVKEIGSGLIEARVVSGHDERVQVAVQLPEETAAACIFDDVAGPLLAGTKSVRPFSGK